MSAELQSIDDQIKAYQSASQVKTQARQLEARIAKIDGAKHLLPARRYGQPVDMTKIRSNLTLASPYAYWEIDCLTVVPRQNAVKHLGSAQSQSIRPRFSNGLRFTSRSRPLSSITVPRVRNLLSVREAVSRARPAMRAISSCAKGGIDAWGSL
jgi:hypothetical protein